MCLGDVIQQHSRESRSGSSKVDSICLRSLQSMAIAMAIKLTDVGHSFSGYTKQEGCQWLKICLYGLYIK